MVEGLNGARDREIERLCPTRNVKIPRRIGGDTRDGPNASTAKISTVGYHRIDDKRSGHIVCSNLETNGSRPKHSIAAVYVVTPRTRILENDRRLLAEFAGFDRHDEIAILCY